jgi:uncharacterized protein YkwD
MRVASLVAVGIASLAVAHAGAGASGPELAPSGRCAAAGDGASQRTLLCLVNWARAANGSGPLREAGRLSRAAAAKGAAIASCNQFSHSPCGADPVAAVRASGYRFRLWGENLYWGSGSLGSPRSAVGGWLGSPGHRQSMLDRRFREIGIASVPWRGRGTIWVIELGRR